MSNSSDQSWEKKFEQKMKNLEKKIESMGKRLEEKGEALGERLESQADSFTANVRSKHKSEGHGLFWGIVLIGVGFIWLGNNLDWFHYDVPWVPVFILAAGIYLVVKHWDRKDADEEE